jgi:hypothetical protein
MAQIGRSTPNDGMALLSLQPAKHPDLAPNPSSAPLDPQQGQNFYEVSMNFIPGTHGHRAARGGASTGRLGTVVRPVDSSFVHLLSKRGA